MNDPSRMPRSRHRRAAGVPIERLAQWNLVIGIATAAMVRVSLELSESDASRANGFFVLLFFIALIAGIVAIVQLRRTIRHVPGRAARVGIAVGSIAAHLIFLQVLVSLVAP